MRRFGALAALVTMALGMAMHAPALPPSVPPCTGDPNSVRKFDLTVSGETATGRYALPANEPNSIVVFGHGYGHTTSSWVNHMKEMTARGAIAVGMDYRGTTIVKTDESGIETSRGWPAKKGAEDTLAAARYFADACGAGKPVYLFGVSMGANMTGLALAAGATRSDNTPLFDYWLDIEGAVNVNETYAGARTLAEFNDTAKNAKADIEAEMGGTIEQVPETYADRAVVTHFDEIAASGVKGVISVHAVEDGLVPYNQSRETVTAMRALGVPLDDYTVIQKGPTSEPGTTITGYSGNSSSPFAGHASEKSSTHIVMKVALQALWDLMAGTPPTCRSIVVDGVAGTASTPAC